MATVGIHIKELSIEETGSRVAATLTEIQEQIDALAYATFESKYASALAAIESAWSTFGASTDEEKQDVIDEIIAGNDAATAWMNLTWSAANEAAAANEDVATAAGIPIPYEAPPA